MMKYRVVFGLLLSLLVVSCNRDTTMEKAQETVQVFFESINNPDLRTTDYYPRFDSLKIEVKSDAIDYLGGKWIGDTIEYHCINNYSDSRGSFKQDTILFYLTNNGDSNYSIVNSIGLATINPSNKEFAYKIGAFKPTEVYDDSEVVNRNNMVSMFIIFECMRISDELIKNVVIGNWRWDVSYYGSANGEAWVENNLPYTVNGVRYKVTYYDRNDNYMTEDDGIVCDKLHSGEKYSFSFWSSNAKYPKRAELELDFSDEFILNKVLYGDYSGYEYDAFVLYLSLYQGI